MPDTLRAYLLLNRANEINIVLRSFGQLSGDLNHDGTADPVINGMARQYRFLIIKPLGWGGKNDGVAYRDELLPVTDVNPQWHFTAGGEMGGAGTDYAGNISLSTQDEHRNAGQIAKVNPAQFVKPDKFIDLLHHHTELVRVGYQRQRVFSLSPLLLGDEITYLINIDLVNVLFQQFFKSVGYPALKPGGTRDLHQLVD